MKELTLNDAFARLPKRRDDSNKGDHGNLLAVVGSAYYRGAAQLSALGALRCGVGILRVASIEKVISPLSASLPEAVFLPLCEGEKGEICGFDANRCLKDFPKTTAILCGCGLTTFGGVPHTVKDIISNCPIPTVLDADALNCLCGETDALRNAGQDIIITPHLGEFARLTGKSIEEIKGNAPEYALRFAREHSLVLVLKSHETLITNGEEIYISRFGNPGLARGGSGDILAGMIASFAAQGLKPIDAAISGVVLHGESADRCARRLSMTGMLPHDILFDLCEIFKEEGR